MKVELLDTMGSDLDVVNAARVSFDKESQWDYVYANARDPNRLQSWERSLKEADVRLIKYLARHLHWTPFSHCYAKFRIKAPLFVRSQLFKHKVGLTENEVSRRYVDSEPEFYVPEVWRGRAENKKQGSSDECVELENPEWFAEFYDNVRRSYRSMVNAGVCPEQARMVLPQSTMTEWIWSGSLAAFARVCKLRTSVDAQWETRQIAEQISGELRVIFPISWGALLDDEGI